MLVSYLVCVQACVCVCVCLSVCGGELGVLGARKYFMEPEPL